MHSQAAQEGNKRTRDQGYSQSERPDIEIMQTQIRNSVDLFAVKVDEVSRVVYKTLDRFADVRFEYEEMALKLKEVLSTKQRLRRKDFDSMLGALLQEMKAREDNLREMVSKFYEQKKDLVNDMLDILAKNSDKDAFIDVEKKLLSLSGQTERELAKELREYSLDQEELRVGLTQLISLEEKITVLEFRRLIKAIRLMRKERLSGPADVLDYLRSLGDDIRRDWDRVILVCRNPSSKGGEIHVS